MTSANVEAVERIRDDDHAGILLRAAKQEEVAASIHRTAILDGLTDDDGALLWAEKKAKAFRAVAAALSRSSPAPSEQREVEAAGRNLYLLQGDNARMVEALRQCREQFAFYASEHTSAGKGEKAATNARFAKIANDALAAVEPAALRASQPDREAIALAIANQIREDHGLHHIRLDEVGDLSPYLRHPRIGEG